MTFSIERSIGIDCGHRVPTHGSKCANLHGHRYTIIARCESSELFRGTEQRDMVLDFGFLKDIMMEKIDALCDHGMVLWYMDEYIGAMWGGDVDRLEVITSRIHGGDYDYYFQQGERGRPTKLLIVPFIPTAERLAQFWYGQMFDEVLKRSDGLATLSKVKVWETPNCCASYP